MPVPLKAAFLQVNNDPNGLQTMFEKDKARMLGFTDWSDQQLQSISAPAFIISGDQDVVTPEHAIKMARLIPQARLMILPGTHGSFIGEICSADTTTKQTELTVAAILDFLNRK